MAGNLDRRPRSRNLGGAARLSSPWAATTKKAPGKPGAGRHEILSVPCLSRADDGDEVVALGSLAAARAAGRNGAGDVIAIDFAVGRCLGEFARLANGVCRRRAALGARGQAAVDAVAVAIVG